MIDDFWKSWAAVAFVAGPMLLACISIGISLYISIRHVDTMVNALKASPYMQGSGLSLLSDGGRGRRQLVAYVWGMITFPNHFVRCGELDAEDARNFPSGLKRLFAIKTMITVVMLVWGAVLGVAWQFR